MRTTIRIDDGLLLELKRYALTSGKTLQAVIDDALRESMARRAEAPAGRIPLPTYRSTGVQPGVDVDDTSSLVDLMEGTGR